MKTYQEVAREKALAQILLPKAAGGGRPRLEAQRARGLPAGAWPSSTPATWRSGAGTWPWERTRSRRSTMATRSSSGGTGRSSSTTSTKRRQGEVRERRWPSWPASGSAPRRGSPSPELARANSDSETRANDGQVGWVDRGAMAPQLDRVVFSLKEGEVSEPVAVPSGAVLLYAREGGPGEELRLQGRQGRDPAPPRAEEAPGRPGGVGQGRHPPARGRWSCRSRSCRRPWPRARTTSRCSGSARPRSPGASSRSRSAAGAGASRGAQVLGALPAAGAGQLLLAEARRSGYADKPETRAELDRAAAPLPRAEGGGGPPGGAAQGRPRPAGRGPARRTTTSIRSVS